jgi:hypothetical protein
MDRCGWTRRAGPRNLLPPGADRRADLLGCADCGEVGCWPLEVCIDVDDAVVTWRSFRQPHRPDRDYTGLGPFRFDAAAYRAALAAALDA